MSQEETLSAICDFMEVRGLSANSIRNYRCDLALFFSWFEDTNDEPCTSESLTNHDMKEFRSWCQTVRNHKASTVNRRIRGLGQLIAYYEQQGQLEPGHMLVRPRELKQAQSPAPRWLSRTEALSLQRAAARISPRDNFILAVLLHTGLRVQELARLRWVDVKMLVRSGEVDVVGKGKVSRTVPLNSDARAAFEARFFQQGFKSLQEAHNSEATVMEIKVRAIQYRVEKMAYYAKLEDCTVHTLRHTFAKSCLDAGAELTEIQMLLGHSRMETTRIYLTPSKRDLLDAVEAITDRG